MHKAIDGCTGDDFTGDFTLLGIQRADQHYETDRVTVVFWTLHCNNSSP